MSKPKTETERAIEEFEKEWEEFEKTGGYEGITTEEWVEGKDNRWKVEFEAEMKYNRMVLYEASILHMQNWKEGMFPTYDRINQVFFL